MKTIDDKELIEKIKWKLANRKNSIIGFESGRRIMRGAFWLSIAYLIGNIGCIFLDFIEFGISTKFVLEAILLLLASIFLSRFLYYSSYKIPNDLPNREELTWNIGRKLYLSKTIYPIFLVLIFLLTVISNKSLPDILLIWAIYGLIFTIAYSLTIFMVARVPRLTFSRLVTGFGSAMFLCELILINLVIIFSTEFFSLEFGVKWILILLILLTISSIFLWIFINVIRTDRLNIVQIHALRVVKPIHLIEFLSKGDDMISNNIKAWEYVQKRVKNKEFGYLQALTEILILEKNKSSQKGLGALWSILLVITTFILTSVGEGLIQDVLNDPIKRWLCDKIELYCEE